MQPFFLKKDINLFYKYLNKTNNYFEYGSGGSTYQVSQRKNIKSIYTVESDIVWYNKMKKDIVDKSNIQFIFCDLKSKPKSWGKPGPDSCFEDWKKYSDAIYSIGNKSLKLDLILIDGRFRVACCLKCFDVINDNCYIAFDDFLNRPEYHIVLDYYKIIEKTDDSRMVILQKKKCNKPPLKLIQRYEKNKR